MVATNVIQTVIQFIILANVVYCSEYYLNLTSTAPAIAGVDVFFYADLYKSDGTRPDNEKLEWTWWLDNGEEQTFETQTPHAEWKHVFPMTKKNDGAKKYKLHLSASRIYLFIDVPIAEAKLIVNITDVLNGELVLIQNGTQRETEFISSAIQLNQTIQIKESDAMKISNATYVNVYWFVDCEYVGQSEQWNSSNFFQKENATHNLEALLVASFEPRPQPQPTTTTTTTTTTTSTTTTTTTTTTPASTTTTTTSTTPPPPPPKRKRRDAPREEYAKKTVEMMMENGEIDPKDLVDGTFKPTTTILPPTHLPYPKDQPYVCFNKSNVAPDPKKIYGYFTRNIAVRNPLSSPVVSGDFWIKREDGMFLNISWSGSPPYYYCYQYKHGPYNITANETCLDDEWTETKTPWITIHRYFLSENSFTILFHVRNQITNQTKIITINTYEVQKQSQLSVIVVPVAFILCAMVAIIFGVAKYVQTRNRFSIEVADFNFGETSSLDLEYKSFVHRLYDSIREALPQRRLTNEVNEDDSSLRYGVMN